MTILGHLTARTVIDGADVSVYLNCAEHGRERQVFTRGDDQREWSMAMFADACRNLVLDYHKEEKHED